MGCEDCTRCHICRKPLNPPEPADSENIPPNVKVEAPTAVESPEKSEEQTSSAEQAAEPPEPSVDLEPPSQAASSKICENESSDSTIQRVQPAPATHPVSNGSVKAVPKKTTYGGIRRMLEEAAEKYRGRVSVEIALSGQDFKPVEKFDEVVNGEVEPCNHTCSSCQATLNSAVDKRIGDEENEAAEFKVVVVSQDPRDAEEKATIGKLQEELALARKIERRMDVTRKVVDAKREKVFKEREKAREEVKKLEKLEKLESIATLRLEDKWNAAKEELISLHNKIEYREEQLKLLEGINAIGRLFKIDCTENIGMINGFQLGGVSPDHKNDSLNVAWGDSVRLLALIKKMFGIELEKYVLMPYGEHSYITTIKDSKIKLPLYLPDKPQGSAKVDFDKGQVAFLDCMLQMELNIQLNHKKTFEFINPISGFLVRDGKLGRHHSIKRRSNTNSSWTKALNLMLVDLKQLLDLYLETIQSDKDFEIPALEEFVE